MPFKGLSKHSKSDELIDPESHGKELQEQEHAADGRFKTSDNPILQLINDAYRSAGRAGRRNYTQSIKNAVEDDSIPGKIVKNIRNVTTIEDFLTEFRSIQNNKTLEHKETSINIEITYEKRAVEYSKLLNQIIA